MHNLKISRQKSLKYKIHESNIIERFIKKRSDLILNMKILRKYVRITLILNCFCDRHINYQINLCNFKINRSTIERKVNIFKRAR